MLNEALATLSNEVSAKIEKIANRGIHHVAVVGIGLDVVFVYILSDKDAHGHLYRQVKKEFEDDPRVKVEKTTTPIAH